MSRPSTATPATTVVDVTDADFEQVVIEGSKQRPVVVDLWASWCAPCRTLGPILEKVAGERQGAFLLAKLDVDAKAVGNALLQAVQSQGIPTVVAFRDGQPVNMFIGAYPEPEVNGFVDSILPDRGRPRGRGGARGGGRRRPRGGRGGVPRRAREGPENREAAVGLARILWAAGSSTRRRPLVEPLLPDPDAERVLAAVRVRDWGSLAGRRRDHPGQGGGRLGTVARGARRHARGVRRRPRRREAGDGRGVRHARMTILLVPEYRPKLAAALLRPEGRQHVRRPRQHPRLLGSRCRHLRRLGVACGLRSARGRRLASRAAQGAAGAARHGARRGGGHRLAEPARGRARLSRDRARPVRGHARRRRARRPLRGVWSSRSWWGRRWRRPTARSTP